MIFTKGQHRSMLKVALMRSLAGTTTRAHWPSDRNGLRGVGGLEEEVTSFSHSFFL